MITKCFISKDIDYNLETATFSNIGLDNKSYEKMITDILDNENKKSKTIKKTFIKLITNTMYSKFLNVKREKGYAIMSKEIDKYLKRIKYEHKSS